MGCNSQSDALRALLEGVDAITADLADRSAHSHAGSGDRLECLACTTHARLSALTAHVRQHDEQQSSPAAEETVTLAALLGFEEPPRYDVSTSWLLANNDSAIFALRMGDLPEGGWVNQGMHERAVWVTVPVDSHEADAAISNSDSHEGEAEV